MGSSLRCWRYDRNETAYRLLFPALARLPRSLSSVIEPT